MNRRAFLGLLATAAAGLAVSGTPNVLQTEYDPERALWEPGKVKVFDLGAMPKGRLEDEDLGLAIRFVRQFNSDTFPCRIDVLYGFAMLQPELAVRISA